jgi:hypothetical protein
VLLRGDQCRVVVHAQIALEPDQSSGARHQCLHTLHLSRPGTVRG